MQREQDEAVRSADAGALVVQGGPGTGKTAVALHRAAYLLYTRPELARRGVLVVGPSAAFLSYVSDVLPGLGEANAVLATVGDLFPGVTASSDERPDVAEVKGRPAMADVVAAAVRDREGAPSSVTVEHEGDELCLSAGFLAAAVAAARATRLPHNEARACFVRRVVAELAEQGAQLRRRRLDALEEGLEAELAWLDRLVAEDLAGLPVVAVEEGLTDEPPGPDELARLGRELLASPRVRAALDRLWPVLTPQQLLASLFADRDRLDTAAAALPAADRALLARPAGSRWTAADVPLLDEAAELLGEDRAAARARAGREHARQVEYAREVLQIAGSGPLDEDDPAVPIGTVDAEQLAERHAEADLRTPAERAAADRTWAYGHVVVDEAQELSPMAWRLLLRRCPTRSFTLVGDMAQAHAPGAAGTWQEALTSHFGSRWRERRLSVNYRTPRETMDVAVRVLALTGAEGLAPRSIRSSGTPPWRRELPAADLARAAAEWAANGPRRGEGRRAVVGADGRLAQVAAAVARAVPGASSGPVPDLRAEVVVLSVAQAKGLEFDDVLIVDPAAILEGPRGANDLYVALTRTTGTVGILHAPPVPPVLAQVRREARGLVRRPARCTAPRRRGAGSAEGPAG
nr:UvrD-helicase domain-containing protein [Motilibacter aurantiacus]